MEEHMAQLAKALTAAAAVAFVLAVVTNFTGNYIPFLTTAEGFSRASTNLALLAIALVLGAGGSRP
jgi:hypothetical protein